MNKIKMHEQHEDIYSTQKIFRSTRIKCNYYTTVGQNIQVNFANVFS